MFRNKTQKLTIRTKICYTVRMFNSLTGVLTEKLPQKVCLDVHGIEWNLTVSDVSLDALPVIGTQCRIFTYLIHKEDQMKLYGFATQEERNLFLDLLKVDGIGPKGAMKILSGSSVESFASALESGEVGMLEALPGISKKAAQKMMLTLKGKLTLIDDSGRGGKKAEKVSKWNDVIVALVEMGYDRRRCEEVVERVASQLMETGKTESQIEGELFRLCIVEMSV